jgi:putative ABC transport system permease protein
LAVQSLVRYYNQVMIERADTTPMMLGATGSPSELVLNALYFKGQVERRISMHEVQAIQESGLAIPVPLHIHFYAQKIPIVGTSLDYFSFRKLETASGRWPQILGEAVIGSAAADTLNLKVGDVVLTDQEKLFDISASYPLRLKIVGVLKESGGPDDLAVFTDIKTAWVIEGIGHGHEDAKEVSDPDKTLRSIGQNLVMSGALIEYNEISLENVDDYHFHGDPGSYPVSSIIVIPEDSKSATIVKARYFQNEAVQAVVPSKVIRDMMDIVFKVKRFFDANFTMVTVSTGLFLVLVIGLSLRIRQREFETLFKIGCAKETVFLIQVSEMVLIFLASSLIAGVALAGLLGYVLTYNILL